MLSKEEKLAFKDKISSMGYREVQYGIWMKPIGYQCFVIDESKNEWINYFKDIQGKVCIWQTKKFNLEQDPLVQIKEFETWTRVDLYCDGLSSFELPSQNYSDILE